MTIGYSVFVFMIVLLIAGECVCSKRHDQGMLLTRKRILSELHDLSLQNLLLDNHFNESDSECGVRLSPLSSNLLEWHFSFTGVQDSAYEGGIYHGRIRLHPEYPRKAPSICMMTPTGRWEVGKEICLSASAHHQETWDMNWNLRTLVMSLRGFILSQPREIGGILTTRGTQHQLAKISRDWSCPICNIQHSDLTPLTPNSQHGNVRSRRRSKLILSSTYVPQSLFQSEIEKKFDDCAVVKKFSKLKVRRSKTLSKRSSEERPIPVIKNRRTKLHLRFVDQLRILITFISAIIFVFVLQRSST